MCLAKDFKTIRGLSETLCSPLEVEDYTVQPVDFVSPPKWHLAHTTWFFENFLLKKFIPSYKSHNELFYKLFNSYYKSQGEHWIQAKRGMLSRPTVNEVYQYRKVVDELVLNLIEKNSSEKFKHILQLGLQHEQQHQELLLMDIKYILATNPSFPSYKSLKKVEYNQIQAEFIPFKEDLFFLGRDYQKGSFCFDNETPRHKSFTNSFSLMNRPITNGEYLNFILDDGYERSELWLSDGWNLLQSKELKTSPLYWNNIDGQWFEYKLSGLEQLDLNSPVSHISYYESIAFANWMGARLPTEAEWERVSNLFTAKESGFLDLSHCNQELVQTSQFYGLHGNSWEWTESSYLPYPGYKQPSGAFGEYNGKFMVNQMVLRGGSSYTPFNHYRNTYRNFFYPHQKWALTGLRLAKDIT